MAHIVYGLGVFASLLCAVLLLRHYVVSRQKLLLWSGLCFVGLAINNILVFIDLVVVPTGIDLHLLRWSVAAVSMTLLVVGLVWESTR